MNIMKNKKKISIFAIAFIVIAAFIGIWFNHSHSSAMHVDVISVKGGYGYQIKEGDRLLIDQPVIPAVTGGRAFKSREDAQKVGQLVLERVKKHTDFSVSTKELRELNIE